MSVNFCELPRYDSKERHYKKPYISKPVSILHFLEAIKATFGIKYKCFPPPYYNWRLNFNFFKTKIKGGGAGVIRFTRCLTNQLFPIVLYQLISAEHFPRVLQLSLIYIAFLNRYFKCTVARHYSTSYPPKHVPILLYIHP